MSTVNANVLFNSVSEKFILEGINEAQTFNVPETPRRLVDGCPSRSLPGGNFKEIEKYFWIWGETLACGLPEQFNSDVQRCSSTN